MPEQARSDSSSDSRKECSIAVMHHETRPLYKSSDFDKSATEKRSMMESVLEVKKINLDGSNEGASQQGVNLGRKEHPFNIRVVTRFQTSNTHHGRCIKAKVSATVGLGFRQPGEVHAAATQGNPHNTPQDLDPLKALVQRQMPSKADLALDPLCEVSFADVLNDVCEDYWQSGNGWLEVVRAGEGDQITGLHHIPAADAFWYLEDDNYNKHIEVVGEEGTKFAQHFPRFGDKKGFLTRLGSGTMYGSISASQDSKRVSEIIHFRQPSSLSRWYGFPDWLSAVAPIELVQCIMQDNYDFHLNRGVPEYMLFVTGQKLSDAEWGKIENSLKANIGLGNAHKSLALNLASKEIEITLHKLALEGGADDAFTKKKENLALDIVSAHGVPPLLAGIQIPGKLGANNELPNALMAFHVLVIHPAQIIFERILANTLGNPALNGGLGLTPEDFQLRSIPEEIDVGTLETVSRMRQDIRGARADGRDLSAGVKP